MLRVDSKTSRGILAHDVNIEQIFATRAALRDDVARVLPTATQQKK